MKYDDLTSYSDSFSDPLKNVLNVGWLDNSSNFNRGVVEGPCIEKLKTLAFSQGPFSACFRIARGFSKCSICNVLPTTRWQGEKKIIGAFQILIPSIDDGYYFAVPSEIIHFIEEHQYLPPDIFLQSIEALDLKCEFNAEKLMNTFMES